MSVNSTSIQRAILIGQLVTIIPTLIIIYIPGFAVGFVRFERYFESQTSFSYQKFIIQFILIEALFVILALTYRRFALRRWKEWAFSVVIEKEELREAAIKKRLMKETDSIPFDPLQWSSIKSTTKTSNPTDFSAHTEVNVGQKTTANAEFDAVEAETTDSTETPPSENSDSSIKDEDVGESTIIRKTKQYLETRLIIYGVVAAWGVFKFDDWYFLAIFFIMVGFTGLIGIAKCLLNDRVYIILDNRGIRINNIDNLTSSFNSRGRTSFGLGGTTRADWADITEISFSNKRIYIISNQYFDANGEPTRQTPQQNFGISNCDRSMDDIVQIVGTYQRKHNLGQRG